MTHVGHVDFERALDFLVLREDSLDIVVFVPHKSKSGRDDDASRREGEWNERRRFKCAVSESRDASQPPTR